MDMLDGRKTCRCKGEACAGKHCYRTRVKIKLAHSDRMAQVAQFLLGD
jgi:hypothetical protein